MEIITFGGGERLLYCQNRLKRKASSRLGKIILLPIPSVGRDGLIKGSGIPLQAVADTAEEGSLVAGYALPECLAESLSEVGSLVYDAARDEDFLLENARLTAHGALGHILSDLKKDVSALRVALVGYGRIGSEMLRLLLFLGAEVTLLTTRESVAKELGEMGVSARVLDGGAALSDFDLVINTAPARLFDEKTPGIFDCPIFDLASGDVLPSLPNIKKLPALPEKMYPETAGEKYADAILRAFFPEVTG